MARNKDLENGLKFLIKECKAIGVNVHKYPWVADLSLILSEYDSCYKFWCSVNAQRKLSNIPYCNSVYDILFNVDIYLMRWSCSDEGHTHWANIFQNMFYPNLYLPPSNELKKMSLMDIHKRIKCDDDMNV